ncbi:MAG TPA: SDR family NAD(P)-dependent oxidoreductase [Ktedonobacteraceae bacterium]
MVKELGRIDILVNNAGINVRKPVEALDEVGWDLLLVARCSTFADARPLLATGAWTP